MTSPQQLFIQQFLPHVGIAAEGIDFIPISGLDTYTSLEQIEDSDTLIERLKVNDIDPFISAIILHGLYVKEHRLADAMKLQILWQNRLDKFNRTPILDFYLGRFFFQQGQCYHLMAEFEVAANYFSKSRKYFLSISFDWAVVALNHAIARSFLLLGASGDARYHYREILTISNHPHLITQIAIDLSQSYLQSNLINKSTSIIEETLKRVDSSDLKKLLETQLEHVLQFVNK